MACTRTSRFAAIASLGGSLKSDFILNATSVPIYAITASQDLVTPPEKIEELARTLNDAGGSVKVEEVKAGPERQAIRNVMFQQGGKVFDFFGEHVRNRFPKKFSWKIPVRCDSIAYYIGLGDQTEGKVDVEITVENRIEITTDKNVDGLTLLISDELFNLEEPIEVYIDGNRKFFDKKDGDIEFLLNCRENWGRHMIFANKLDFTDLREKKDKKKRRRSRKRADAPEKDEKDNDNEDE